MSQTALTGIGLGLYGLVALLVARRGLRRINSLPGFFVGNRDLHPVLVGLSLGGQLTAVGIFVIHPGLLHQKGPGGLLGLGLSTVLGTCAGAWLLCRGFRRLADELGAFTVPGWLGRRYRSHRLQLGFALLSLALVSLLALVGLGLASLAARLLGVPVWLAVALLVVLVLLGVVSGGHGAALLGGLQALIMTAGAGLLIVIGLQSPEAPGLLARLPALTTFSALGSGSGSMVRMLFEVFAANFLVGMGMVCQPQVASRVLYLGSPAEVGRFLRAALLTGLTIAVVLLGGLLAGPIAGPGPTMELVLGASGSAGALASLAVICAGLITVEGLFLALSGIFALDLLEPILRARAPAAISMLPPSPRLARLSLALVAMLVIALLVAEALLRGEWLRPLAIHSLHLLLSASFLPILIGLLVRRELPGWLPALAALTAVASYLGLGATRLTGLAGNPVGLAALAILASAAVTPIGLGFEHAWRRRLLTSVESTFHAGTSRG